jgi:hypothetical protein
MGLGKSPMELGWVWVQRWVLGDCADLCAYRLSSFASICDCQIPGVKVVYTRLNRRQTRRLLNKALE